MTIDLNKLETMNSEIKRKEGTTMGINLDELAAMNKETTEQINEVRDSYNLALIRKNIEDANENANRNVTNVLNLIGQNKMTADFVLNSERVKEYVTLSKAGYTSIIRGLHTQDTMYAKLNGFDAMDNNGNIFTANMLNVEGYDLDHILPYEYLLDPKNSELLADIVISYDGDIEKAFDDLMTRNPKNFIFATAHVNRSKGGNLGSSEKCKYSQLTDEQKEAVRNEYLKREKIAKDEATKNAAANKLKGKLDQLKDTLRNMIVVAVVKFLVKVVANKLMEVAGQLMLKSVHKKWYSVLKEACGKDAIKKLCSKIYAKFKDIKDSFKRGLNNFISLFKDGKGLATKIVEGLLSMVKKAGVMLLQLVLGISRLVLKAIQLMWSVARLVKNAIEYAESKKAEGSYAERLNTAKSLAYSIVSVIVDAIDVAIEIVLKVVFAGVDLAAWIMPLINIVLNLVCTVLSYTVAMFIDVADSLMVNASNRVKLVKSTLL